MTEEEKQIVDLRIENARISEQLKASDKALVLASTAWRANLALAISVIAVLLTLWKMSR